MPKHVRTRINEAAVVPLLVAVNGLLALGVLGLQYSRFSWAAEASALTYYPTPTPSATPTRTPSLREDSAGPAACADHIDNDNNGLTDCVDPACRGASVCKETAPTLSWSGIAAAALLIALVGLSALSRPPTQR